MSPARWKTDRDALVAKLRDLEPDIGPLPRLSVGDAHLLARTAGVDQIPYVSDRADDVDAALINARDGCHTEEDVLAAEAAVVRFLEIIRRNVVLDVAISDCRQAMEITITLSEEMLTAVVQSA